MGQVSATPTRAPYFFFATGLSSLVLSLFLRTYSLVFFGLLEINGVGAVVHVDLEYCLGEWNQWIHDDRQAQDVDQVDVTRKIGRAGNSLTVSITKEAQMLGLDQGDLVKITLERVNSRE